MSQIISTLASIGSSLANGLSRALLSAGRTGVIRAQQSGAVIVQQKAFATGIISFGITVAGFIGWLITIAAVWVLIPLIVGLFYACSSGLTKAMGGYLSLIQSHTRTTWWWKGIAIFLKGWVVVLRAFLRYFVLWIAANIGLLLSLATISFLFIYFVGRHLNWTISVADDASIVVINVVNFIGAFLEILLQLANLINPFTHMVLKQTFLLLIHIYDGIEYSIRVFGNAQFSTGRRLGDMGFSEYFFDFIEPFIQLGLAIMQAQLLLMTTVIDIFFQLGFAHIILYLMDVFIILFTKLGCIVSGQWCSLLELFHFIVNDYILSIVELLCFGLCTIPDVPIACTAGVLASLDVPNICAGGIFSIDPPGWFSQLNPSRRRLSSGHDIVCENTGGKYREYLNGNEVHSATSNTDACPHARASFHEYGHALNMEQLDTHSCYTVCARGVAYKACPNGRREFIGSCSSASPSYNMSYGEAKVRLDGFFSMETGLSSPLLDKNREQHGSYNREELAAALKEMTGMQFTIGGIRCDLTRPQNSYFEAIVDYGCIAARIWSVSGNSNNVGEIFKHGRHLSDRNTMVIELLEHLSKLRHTTRISQTYVDGYRHPSVPMDNPVIQMKKIFIKVVNYQPRNATRIGKTRGVVRRQLNALITCPPGQVLCANQEQCVVDFKDCTSSETFSILQLIMYYLERASIFISGIDMETFFGDMFQCWRDLTPETDPTSFENIFSTEEQRAINCIWCFPSYPPMHWTWTDIHYSLRDSISKSCAAVSNVFSECQCPMFYSEITTTLPYWNDWVSVNFMTIFFNGLIVFKNIWVFVVGDFIGICWSNLLPEPAFPPGVSRVFSLYSTEITWDVYWFCNFISVGYATGTLLILWFMLQAFRFSLTIFMFIVYGGMTREERVRQWNFRWMEIGRVWHELLDTSGTVARLNYKVAKLEEAVKQKRDVEKGF